MSALIRYETPATTLSNLLDDFLGTGIFNAWDRDISLVNYPRVDIVEEKDTYKIRADMPGLDKKDIAVEVKNGVLSLSGEKKEEKTEKEKNRYYHYERRYGSFRREFALPDHVDAEHVEAKYANGVLELTLRKTEAARPKQIEVKVE
ncbi:MAG TPA: Hsp20/alpha crystallin family protein [Chitinivibrionales bacterium]|nr:Hsp20/alpha crystallin family protein [Chitinivibrionales bacterium]